MSREFGREPSLPDTRRPRDEHEPSVTAAGLPPRASQPPQFVFSVREGQEVVELRWERCLRRRRLSTDDASLDGRADLEQFDGLIESLQVDGASRLECHVLEPARQLRDIRGDEDLAGGGLRAEPGGHVERLAPVAVLHRDGRTTIDPNTDGQGKLGISRPSPRGTSPGIRAQRGPLGASNRTPPVPRRL